MGQSGKQEKGPGAWGGLQEDKGHCGGTLRTGVRQLFVRRVWWWWGGRDAGIHPYIPEAGEPVQDDMVCFRCPGNHAGEPWGWPNEPGSVRVAGLQQD